MESGHLKKLPVLFPSDGRADHVSDRGLPAHRGEQPAALPRLLAAQRHRRRLFPRMQHQAVRLVGERLREARLRPGHVPGPGRHQWEEREDGKKNTESFAMSRVKKTKKHVDILVKTRKKSKAKQTSFQLQQLHLSPK